MPSFHNVKNRRVSTSAPRQILVVSVRRIGDTLLATPLIHSLKQTWPDALIDVLVFQGVEGILEGNEDIRRILAVKHRQPKWHTLRDLRAIWRQYDLAVTPMSSDRSRMYVWAGGRRRLGMVDAALRDWPKRLMLNRAVTQRVDAKHIAVQATDMARHAGAVVTTTQVVPPKPDALAQQHLSRLLEPLGTRAYAVLHPYPKYNYKMWTTEGWIALARWLMAEHMGVVLSGSGDPGEKAYADSIAQALPATLNLAGQLTLAQTASLIRGAKLYVGPDTSVTHIASATGTPVVAIFGPTDPARWGPWPISWMSAENPWRSKGNAQQGNVYVLQGEQSCVPCRQEGCARHLDSSSDCLTQLSADRVIQAVQTLLRDAL